MLLLILVHVCLPFCIVMHCVTSPFNMNFLLLLVTNCDVIFFFRVCVWGEGASPELMLTRGFESFKNAIVTKHFQNNMMPYDAGCCMLSLDNNTPMLLRTH